MHMIDTNSENAGEGVPGHLALSLIVAAKAGQMD